MTNHLLERAVRAVGMAPTKLLGRPISYFSDDAFGEQYGWIVGFTITDAHGLVLTVQSAIGGELCHAVHLDYVSLIGEPV